MDNDVRMNGCPNESWPIFLLPLLCDSLWFTPMVHLHECDKMRNFSNHKYIRADLCLVASELWHSRLPALQAIQRDGIVNITRSKKFLHVIEGLGDFHLSPYSLREWRATYYPKHFMHQTIKTLSFFNNWPLSKPVALSSVKTSPDNCNTMTNIFISLSDNSEVLQIIFWLQRPTASIFS